MKPFKCRQIIEYFVFLLIIVEISCANEVETSHQTTCFHNNKDTCQDQTLKILNNYYSCDTVISLNDIPKRINCQNDKIFVSTASETFILDKDENLNSINKILPPWTELYDHHNNKYYSGDGTTYVSIYGSDKEIEIITSGKFSFNQIAMDMQGQKLFILSFHPKDKENVPYGQLYVTTTEVLNITTDNVIIAEPIGLTENITAIGVQGNSQRLILALNYLNKYGKLVLLNKHQDDPCKDPLSVYKERVPTILKETEDKLFNMFTNQKHMEETVDELQKENDNLKNQLQKSNGKLDNLIEKLISLEMSINIIKIMEYNISSEYNNTLTELIVKLTHHRDEAKSTEGSGHSLEGSGSGGSKFIIEGSGNHLNSDDEDYVRRCSFQYDVKEIIAMKEKVDNKVQNLFDSLDTVSNEISSFVSEIKKNETSTETIWIDNNFY